MQPAKLLFLSPLVFSLSIYIAFVYGAMYLLFTTVTLVFSHTYGFNERQTGLIFLSLGAGTAIGWPITTIWSDRDVARLVRANNGTYVPEMRLHITLGFAFLMPLTFFWYGWSAYYKAHFMSTILSLIPFQTGIVGVVIPMTTYLIDSYPVEAANAMAAMTVLRSIGGMLLPLAGRSMYRALGYGWGNSLLGFICVGLTPLPWLFYMYGGKLRAEKNNNF